jgi:hypothetical protein
MRIEYDRLKDKTHPNYETKFAVAAIARYRPHFLYTEPTLYVLCGTSGRYLGKTEL